MPDNDFEEMMPDTVDLEGADGSRVEGIRCQVDGRTVVTMNVAVKFRTGDVLVRTLPNGLVERHRILSADYRAPGDELAHVEMKVEQVKMGVLQTALTAASVLAATRRITDIEIFISHSAKDAKAAEKLVVLLAAATGLLKSQVRCTSVDGSKLKTGARTDTTLLAEIQGAKAFVALLSKASLASGYVMFELGARWGSELHYAPMILAPNGFSLLPGPLPGHHAIVSSDRPAIQQVLAEIADVLGRELRPAHSFESELKTFLAAREQAPRSKRGTPGAATPPPASSPVSAEPAMTREESILLAQGEILKRFTGRRGVTETVDMRPACVEAGLSSPSDIDFVTIVQGLVLSGLKLVSRTGRVATLVRPELSVTVKPIKSKW